MTELVLEKQPQKITEQSIPKFWRNLPFKVLRYALDFGLVKWSYTLKNYVQDAIETQGYETILVWGVQGVGKSCQILQQGYWIFEDWDKVLASVVAKPKDFVQALKSIPFGKRTPWIGWDDVGVHFPSVSWRTNIEEYAAVDSAWAAIRTKCNVVSLNIPLIDRLAKNLKDNMTAEVFIGRNQAMLIERYVRLPGLKKLESNFFKIQVEPIHKFNLFDVPKDVFKEYWQTRLKLTEEALDRLGNVLSKGDETVLSNDYVAATNVCQEYKISPRTLQIITTDMIKHLKLDGKLYLLKEDVDKVIKLHYKKRNEGIRTTERRASIS